MHIRFLILVVVTQIVIIFFHIHKHSHITQLMYKKQRLEKISHELLEKKTDLQHALAISADRTMIKKEALDKGMKGIRLPSISKAPSHVQS